MTKLRVLVLSFPHFTDISTIKLLICSLFVCVVGGTGGSLILEIVFITLKGLEVFLWFQKFPKKNPICTHFNTEKLYRQFLYHFILF
jgi:hypothetical protein